MGGSLLIEGIAGAGKTTLAIHAVHALLKNFEFNTDLVVFVSARTAMLQTNATTVRSTSIFDIDELTSTISIVLGRLDLLRMSPAERSIAIVSILSGFKSLLIIDNFETIVDIDLLSYIKSLPESCSILITSRQLVESDVRIHLKELNKSDSHLLVKEEMKRWDLPVSKSLIHQVAEQSGGIPLAINWLVGRRAYGAPHELFLAKPSGTDPESKDEALLSFLFENAIDEVRKSSTDLTLLYLSYSSGPVDKNMLLHGLSWLGLTKPESAVSISNSYRLNLISYDVSSQRYSILPIIRRFLENDAKSAKYDDRDSITSANLADGYAHSLIDHLNVCADRLWSSGYELAEWDLDRGNTFSTIKAQLERRNVCYAAEIIVAFYPFAITFGHFREFIELSDTLLEISSNFTNLMTVNIGFRRSSILFHSGNTIAAEEEFSSVYSKYCEISDPDDVLVDLMYFLRSIIAVETKSLDTETILLEAITFSADRGLLWTRLGFQGWLGIHYVNFGELDKAFKILNSSLEEANRSKDFRTASFLYVGLARAFVVKNEPQTLIELSSEWLAISSEFAEDHNYAHLLFEIGRAWKLLEAFDNAERYSREACNYYVKLGSKTDINKTQSFINTLLI